MSSTLVLPLTLVAGLGLGFGTVSAVISLTMIAAGIGTILQGVKLPFIGSGYLCPNLCGPNFFSASASAAWLGGLPLMRGMTIVAGLFQVVFARFIPRLAFLFPTEITGLVVMMVGVSLIPVGTSKFMHINYAGEPINLTSMMIAAVTLLLMAGMNVWGSPRVRLYGVLLGMIAGYVLSYSFGLMPATEYANVGKADWIGLPQFDGMMNFAFEWSLLPTFIIVSICGALKSFGNLVLAEKNNDEEWQSPNTNRIGNGLVADGISVSLSGLLGGMATDTSSSNVAMSGATGATSRYIGFAAGALFIILGFSPKIGALLSVMPPPVAGAIVVFVICFMVTSGLQMIVSSKLDTRRIFTIGIAFCFGMSLDIVPALYAHVPSWIRPLFDSSLTLATVIAILLTQILRIGAEHKSPPISQSK
jgi:NCS2 family nucleobase:cation symporter-2